mmetsp:Transcript_77863/g.140480  ORF Transcript_77863/g.140480 Transcript_77863/m.140480 type:complete len:438 (-) Transcript_77863:40-1353(-)
MLVVLCCALVGLRRRFAPSQNDMTKDYSEEDAPLPMGLAVFSAVLRLFFPAKPREHLSALKKLLLPMAKLMHRRESKTKAPGEHGGSSSKASLHSDKDDSQMKRAKPLNLDLRYSLGIPILAPDDRFQGGPEMLLENLLRNPTPLVHELRRQHLVECLMFVDKLTRALRVIGRRGGHGDANGDGSTTAGHVSAREAFEAMSTADRDLTEDQKHLYLLRGFGRRLPDMPSAHSAGAAEEAVNLDFRAAEALASAARVQKVRKMIKEHASQLFDGGTTAHMDDFVRRLSSSGVIKGGRQWTPHISDSELAQEAGLNVALPSPSTATLEELCGGSVAFGDDAGGQGRTLRLSPSRLQLSQSPSRGPGTMSRGVSPCPVTPRALDADSSPGGPESPPEEPGVDLSEPLERYKFLVEVGKDIHELSVGYPGMGLAFWVNSPV